MAGFAGRKAVFKIGALTIGAVKVKGISIGNTPIDISSDDDAEWRSLLEEAGTRTIDITVSGVEKSLALMKLSVEGTTLLNACSFEFPPSADNNTTTGAAISGNFFLASYSMGADSKEAATFDASFSSSGAITFIDGTTV